MDMCVESEQLECLVKVNKNHKVSEPIIVDIEAIWLRI